MFYVAPPSDEGGGFLRSKKTEGEKKLPLSRLPPTAPLTRGAGNRLALLREEGGTRSVTGGACGSFGFIKLTIAACSLRPRIRSTVLPKGRVKKNICKPLVTTRPPCLKGAGSRRLTGGYCRFAADRPEGDYPSDLANARPPPSRRGRLSGGRLPPLRILRKLLKTNQPPLPPRMISRYNDIMI